ncbi:MAG: peptidase S9, partial [Rhodothermales bacterium]|nr:peptidase S9 [Rhodothermales bacterium]
MRRSLIALAALFALNGLSVAPGHAQYFGRNKVQYDTFDFKTIQTEHFEVYFYDEEQQAARDASRMAERWYRRHSRTYLREFRKQKPLILYANDADFQQTNVIGGLIGQGTGGVTESLKERVVMPMTGLYAETDHVLGHELVHSFQYDIALSREDTTRFGLSLLPLWLIEGTAEYLSVGRD